MSLIDCYRALLSVPGFYIHVVLCIMVGLKENLVKGVFTFIIVWSIFAVLCKCTILLYPERKDDKNDGV